MTDVLLASTIEAIGVVIAATITFLGMLFASRRITSRTKLKNDLKQAYDDIIVLYAIEEAHVSSARDNFGVSNKVKVRKTVEQNKGITLSNVNVPSQLRKKLAYLKAIDD